MSNNDTPPTSQFSLRSLIIQSQQSQKIGQWVGSYTILPFLYYLCKKKLRYTIRGLSMKMYRILLSVLFKFWVFLESERLGDRVSKRERVTWQQSEISVMVGSLTLSHCLFSVDWITQWIEAPCWNLREWRYDVDASSNLLTSLLKLLSLSLSTVL